ncbi:MAG: hypothetical protein EXX96DRAFT_552604 [Benjaminiella poitrasii]|nr:MAG: hypothetical protein EXX96DRAFT_552604 [Benjaminiella poitrasii]
MQPKKEFENRRSSLSISALLNKDVVEPVKAVKSLENRPPLSHMPSSDTTATTSTSESHLFKAKRKRISPHQYSRLMETFNLTDTPSSEIRENLALELKMTKREVQVWFQNRRAKMNRLKNASNNDSIGHGRQRQLSLISPPHPPPFHPSHTHYYQMKPRRASAHPILENHVVYTNNGYPPPPLPPHPPLLSSAKEQSPHPPVPIPNYNGPHPVVSMPINSPLPTQAKERHGFDPYLPQPHHFVDQHKYQSYSCERKESAIDLLASAAEYVQTDKKENPKQ